MLQEHEYMAEHTTEDLNLSYLVRNQYLNWFMHNQDLTYLVLKAWIA